MPAPKENPFFHTGGGYKMFGQYPLPGDNANILAFDANHREFAIGQAPPVKSFTVEEIDSWPKNRIYLTKPINTCVLITETRPYRGKSYTVKYVPLATAEVLLKVKALSLQKVH